ncbi:MAG: GDSL-type esterase/lipase family protein, partial [Cyanobacteriota bacterium]
SQSNGSGFDADHEGHGGWRADQIDANIASWLSQYYPDVVLLHIGTNDIHQLQSNSSTATDIQNILTKIYTFSSKSVILLCKLIPRSDEFYQNTEDLNVLIEQVYQDKKNAGYNIYLVDQNVAFKNNPNWANDYLADPVHPSHSGYAVMADKFKSVLITVKFKLTIAVNPAGSGTVQRNPDKTQFSYNEQVNLIAQASSGYQFESWSGDITTSGDNPITINMWKSRNIAANFNSGSVETVSTPSTPSGPTSGTTNSSLSYSTGGAASSLGHDIEYLFSWGDGQESSWDGANRSHSYSSAGTYQIRARARCVTHTNIVSDWSSSLTVTISSATETVSAPSTPSGPSSGIANSSLSYSTGGAASSLGHDIEYLFSWGDGQESSWDGANRSHSYSSAGTYQIRARARCVTHTNIVSDWSSSLTVTISSATETVSAPSTPSGPSSGIANSSLSYSTGGAA